MKCSIGMSPGQEGIVLRVKRHTHDFWSQQKQAHLDSQPILASGSNSTLFDSKAGSGVNLLEKSPEKLKAKSHS